MSDKKHIIYGHLAATDFSFGFISFDGTTWRLDEEAAKQHFAAIANAGANAVRILPHAVWEKRPYGRKSQFSPWALGADNLWDLSKFNAHYFRLMHRLFEIINSYNMTVWFPLFDMCQMHKGYWTGMTPWLHNKQGITSFYDKAADKYCAAWVEKCFAEFKGLDMFWPWGNELGGKAFPGWARRVIFPLIRKLTIPFGHMTYGAVMGEAPYLGGGKFGDSFTLQDTARKFFGEDFPPESNKFLLIREVHKCGTTPGDKDTPWGLHPAQAAYWWGNKPVGGFVLSDDGTKENWPSGDGGRPDAAKWEKMAAWAFGFKNCAGVEHCPEGGDLAYQADVIEHISMAYKDRFGAWPANHGKWHYEPPQPPPPPDPEPEPESQPEPQPEPIPEPPAPGLPGIDKMVIIGGAIALILAAFLLLL